MIKQRERDRGVGEKVHEEHEVGKNLSLGIWDKVAVVDDSLASYFFSR